MKQIIVVVLLLISANSFAQTGWEQVYFHNPSSNPWLFDMKIYGNIGIASSFTSNLWRSSDGGLNWFKSGDSIKNTMKISKINTTIWIGSIDTVPYRSTNGGLNFYPAGNGITPYLNYPYFNNVAGNSTKIFTGSSYGGTYYNRAYYSSNNGNNWRVIDSLNRYSIHNFNAAFADDSVIIFGTSSFLLRSFDDGVNWQSVSDTLPPFHGIPDGSEMVKTGNKLYVPVLQINMRSFLYSTTDYGTTWKWETNGIQAWGASTIANLESYNGYTFFYDGGYSRKMYYSHYTDTIWKAINTESKFLSNGYLAGNYIYVFYDNNLQQVYRKRIEDVIGINQISSSIPDKFHLRQNYPNPFNPNTNIEFSFPQKSFVKLKVFDLLGREIANLVNENLSAGKYKYDFNASLLPSGIYFYKLETENFSETRKMVLIK